MRKFLLASGSVLTLVMGAGELRAQNIDAVFAAALSFNYGEASSLTGSIITSDRASATGSISGNRGVTQSNQNAGAGSLTQNSAAVAVIDGVRVSPFTTEVAGSYAAAGNLGTVGSGSVSLGGTTGTYATGSVNSNLGVTQANQNAGAGSLLQNSVALASIGFCGDCPDVDLNVTVARAGNYGTVASLTLNGVTAATASMANSINANEGLTQVSQNAGAGSLTQNSIAVGAMLPQFSSSPFNFR